MRIAALDDDLLQLELYRHTVEAMEHQCHSYSSGSALIKALRRESFDLLIVDWEMPGMHGPDVVRWVRENVEAALPIIFVTHRSGEQDIINGLSAGADDFMTKPVRVGELVARVNALLRRAYPAMAQNTLNFGRYRFDQDARTIAIDGAPVTLKNREYDLALYLFQNMGRLLSRDHLRETIWGHNEDVLSRSLDTHISRLRTQLDLRPDNGFILHAIYGVGYRFEAVPGQ